MSQEFDRVRDVVVTAGSAWDTLVPRLRDLRERLAEAKASAVELGEDGADVDELQQRVDRLGEAVASDPLSVNAREFDTLESDLGRLRVSLDGATQLRDEMRERVAKARAVLDELRGAIRAATAAHREVIVKIASPHVPEPPALDDGLVRELDTAVALSEQSRWRAAQDALSEWSDRADAQLRRAHECATANRAPIDARNELRGRLDAYHAMAHGTGMLEDPDASSRYERARAALFTAPTDVDEAADLVREYQDALSARPRDGEEPR
jgi:hypothetical protein